MSHDKHIVQVGVDSSLPGGIRTVMTTLRDSYLADKYGMDIVGTASRDHRFKTFLSGLSEVRHLVRGNECDCVHIHMSENASVFRAVWIIRWVKRHSSAKIIVHSHGGSVQRFFGSQISQVRNYLLYWLGQADCFVTLTKGWTEWWKTLLPKMRFSVIPNSVVLPERTSPISPSSGAVLFLGELCDRKGVYCLLEAARIVTESHPSVQFIFAGKGEIDRCWECAKAYKIEENCNFPGWADDEKKVSLFQESTVFVLPSKEESFGIALLEAMSYSLPVICSNGGYMHEVVDDGVDGIVFPVGDAHALAIAICRLIDSPELACEMGKRGRDKVQKNYTTPAILRFWEQLYTEVLFR